MTRSLTASEQHEYRQLIDIIYLLTEVTGSGICSTRVDPIAEILQNRRWVLFKRRVGTYETI